MQELEKILEKMKEIKDGNRKEKLYAKYPPNSKNQEILNVYSQGYEDGTDNFYNATLEIIRKHMNAGERFEFDFTNVKSFDCQCGRHYINTAADGWIPVEEALPEIKGSYLVTIQRSGDYERPKLDMISNYFIKERGLWSSEDFSHDHVIAWQPLPQPYEPGRRDAVERESNNL